MQLVSRSTSTNGVLNKAGYEVVKKIGNGSYAQVKEVSQGLQRLAVKVIDTTKVSVDFKGRFLPRELEILTKVQHEHIIDVLRIFKAGEKVFVVMELAEGGDLLEYVQKKQYLSETRSRLFFTQILQAVEYLHGIDIAHRDLKCDNILLKNTRHVKLADFGLSCFCSFEGQRTLSKTFCGSTSYASPEVLMGTAYNPKMNDVWSMGCILYVMLFGTIPFVENDVKTQLKQQLTRNIIFPDHRKVHTQAEDLILQMLEPDSLNRTTIKKIFSHPWLINPQAGDGSKYI